MTTLSSRRIVVTGPSRSGKSEWAEHLAAHSGKAVIYIATSVGADDGAGSGNQTDQEWLTRIAQHQRRRPKTWETQEVPVNLVSVLEQSTEDQCLLIDSLGTWLANVLDQSPSDWQQSLTALVAASQICPSQLIFVAEEVGWGVVPAYPLGRVFRDRLGELVRQLVAIADDTYLVTAGHVLNLRQLGMPLSQALKANP